MESPRQIVFLTGGTGPSRNYFLTMTKNGIKKSAFKRDFFVAFLNSFLNNPFATQPAGRGMLQENSVTPFPILDFKKREDDYDQYFCA